MIFRNPISILAFSLIFALALQSTNAFTSKILSRRVLPMSSVATLPASERKIVLFSTPPEGEAEQQQQLDAFADPISADKSVPERATETSYPIDLPSPILLASSMVLAIVGVGSGFDIFSDAPRFPFAVNAAISAGGLATCLGLFYASILKAQAETEEDDKRYMSGR